MGFPYAFMKVMRKEEPFLDRGRKSLKGQEIFLRRKENMRGLYLGACLDSIRWGGQTTVMYEMGNIKMISFIRNWMRQNEGNFQDLFHERGIDELYKRFELPHTDHKVCPRDKGHKERVMDRGGRLRCAHVDRKKLRSSFIQSYRSGDRMVFLERDPLYEVPEDENHWSRRDKALIEKYDAEEPTAEIIDPCYVIISDKGRVLSFETILNRLNLAPKTKRVHCPGNDHIRFTRNKGCTKERLNEMDEEERLRNEDINFCPGHTEPINDRLVFPFDGWDLAFYVQKWWGQKSDGSAPIFEE